MAKPPKTGLDPLQIFLHASSFHESYQCLLRSALPVGSKQADHHTVAIIFHPALTLSAFASELYLKCLLCVETNAVPNTHNLKELFEGLPVSIRHELDNLWDYDIRQPGKLAVIEQLKRLPGGEDIRRDLRYALDVGADSFMDLRYYYERQESYCLLQDFPSLLRKAILNRFPSWGEIRPTPPQT